MNDPMGLRKPQFIERQFTTIEKAHPPDFSPGEGKYNTESFVDKGDTPEDPMTWNHKEKLAILGTAGSMHMAPYTDEEFEIWAVAQCVTFGAFRRADLLFEIHNESYWRMENVLDRLRNTEMPIYMMDKFEEVPYSIRFPIEVMQYYRKYHMTSITYMLALAYHLFKTTGNPKHVALFGVHMESSEEYTEQRPCCEYWLGQMEASGIDIYIPPVGALLKAPYLYAYEGYNPAIPVIRNRLNLLQNGLAQRDVDARKAREEFFRQDGAVAECAYWLRAFQKGEVNG